MITLSIIICLCIDIDSSPSANGSFCGGLTNIHPMEPYRNLKLQVTTSKISNGPVAGGLAPVGWPWEAAVVVDLGVACFVFLH